MSSVIRFIGDTHFGHINMALHRGFSSIEEHDEYIIDRWNSVVKKHDTTLILGDVTMEKTNYEIINRLKGFKKVILGNHDHHGKELLKYVNSVWGSFKYQGCILTHIPIHESELERFRFNIHAHLHEKVIDDPRYISVSCEQVDYIPKSLEELLINT